jgi:type IV fimbrial biogenesis protein FimT
MSKRQAGFTLIELLVVIVVIGISLAIGLPSYRVWIQNTKIRTTAESIRNGLQLARSEAVKRNAPVQFQFNAGGTSGGWQVCAEDAVGGNSFINCTNTIQVKPAAEGGTDIKVYSDSVAGTLTTPLATAGVTTANATYTALGRMQNFGPPNIARVDVRRPDLGADERNLVIVVGTGGSVRVCDPKLGVGSDPRGC